MSPVPEERTLAARGHDDVNVNDAVAFLVEIAVVVLLSAAGFRYDGSHVVATALGVGLPLVAAVLWGVFAPRERGSTCRWYGCW